MFGISWSELAVIFIIAIIFIDPKDIPGLARKFTSFIKNVKSFTSEFTSVITKEIEEPRKYIKDLEGKMQPTYDLSDIMNKEDKDKKDV